MTSSRELSACSWCAWRPWDTHTAGNATNPGRNKAQQCGTEADPCCPHCLYLITEGQEQARGRPGPRPDWASLPLGRPGPHFPLSLITNKSPFKRLRDLVCSWLLIILLISSSSSGPLWWGQRRRPQKAWLKAQRRRGPLQIRGLHEGQICIRIKDRPPGYKQHPTLPLDFQHGNAGILLHSSLCQPWGQGNRGWGDSCPAMLQGNTGIHPSSTEGIWEPRPRPNPAGQHSQLHQESGSSPVSL